MYGNMYPSKHYPLLPFYFGSPHLASFRGGCSNRKLGFVQHLSLDASVSSSNYLSLYASLAKCSPKVEFIGFCARAAAAEKTNKLMPYIIQSAFILLPPSLFAATIYMCLGRVIKLVGGEHLSLIRPSRLTKVFVSADVVSFIIQGGSSGLTILAFQHPIFGTIGKAMVIGGLVMQLISFSLFFYTAVSFYSHFRQAPTSRSFQIDGSWVQTIYMLYQVSWLIIIRSTFRIVEYSMGPTGYPLTHEWTLYVFDTIPMLAVALLFYLKYPDNLVLSRDIGSELESQLSEERIL